MQQDLMDMEIWSTEFKDELLYHEGSIQFMSKVPDFFKQLYKTVWDMSQKVIIDI